ncbi:MAG TPA: chemotaxis protein CheW [Bacillales bacterium]|nr:chemotaxis protein CheW [Bacillales bacterium]
METETKAIVFQLNNEEYGVEIMQVRSIEKMQPITRVPKAPDFVKGVINLRGVVTPIVDLRRRFSFDEIEETEETRIIIVHVDGTEVGLIVDGASDVIDLSEEQIEPPSDLVGGVKAEYLRGVANLEDRLLIMLNLKKVLNPGEIAELREFEESENDVV